MNTHSKGDPAGSRVTLPLGLDGLFRGLAHVLQLVNRVAENAPADETGAVEVTETGSIGIPAAAQAAYGVSVRIGPRVAPPRRPVATTPRNTRDKPIIVDLREAAADVLDEGDHYLVVVELPGVQEHEIEWSVRDHHTLTIRAAAADRNYRKDISLTEAVDPRRAQGRFATGILELRLWKMGSR